jgi:hypothetical protein
MESLHGWWFQKPFNSCERIDPVDSVSPVLTTVEVPSEQVIALGQDEFYLIVVARVVYGDKSVGSLTRYRFTAAERELVLKGADLILGQPHHGSMMPISLQLAMPGEYPVEV